MSQKRYSDDGKAESESNPNPKRRRFSNFKHLFLDPAHLNSLKEALEPVIRKVIKEEIDSVMKKYVHRIKQHNLNDGKETLFSESRILRLIFVDNLSLPIFTGSRIGGVSNSSLKIALIDALTGKYVDYEPESSAKVEILVLQGDFDGDDTDNWRNEEFCSNILREREGRKPLLTGDMLLNLKNGTGFVGEIYFTDNSSWTRSRRFRLGARVVDNFPRNIIREAVTESFIVRDHRGELYKKHHPPCLSDEVWRLEKIGKGGAFHRRLSRDNINTVKDFLTLYYLNRSKLRRILGSGMSPKMWEVTVEHARTCLLDKSTTYLYRPLLGPEKDGVVFNVVGQVVGIISNSEYVSIDKLSESKKVDAQYSVFSAFDNWDRVTILDDLSSAIDGSSSSLGIESYILEKMCGFDESSTTDWLSDFAPFLNSIDIELGPEQVTQPYEGFIDYYDGDHDLDFRHDQSSSSPSKVMCVDQLYHLPQFLETDELNLEFGQNAESSVVNPSTSHQVHRAKTR